MSRAMMVLCGVMILVAPFGEGGRAAESLFLLHTLALGYMVTAALFALREPSRERRPRVVFAITTLVLAALLAAVFSAVRAAYPLAAAFGFIDLVIPAGLVLAGIWTAGGPRDVERLRAIVVTSTTLQAMIALWRWTDGGVPAAGSVFLNPNHLAAFLNVGFLCALVAACRGGAQDRWSRGLWAALAGFHLVVVGLLESRGAFLGLLGAGVVVLVFHWRSWRGRQRLMVSAAVVLFMAVSAGILANRFARADDPFPYHRLSIWKATFDMLSERPLLGYGPGMFRYESPRHNFPVDQGPIRYGRVFQGAHSAVLTLAAESGTLAAGCLGTAGVLALLVLLRASGRPGDGPSAEGFALALSALLVQGMVEDLQERPALTLLVALVVGVTLCRSKIRDEPGSGLHQPLARSGPRPPARSVAGATLLLALYTWVAGVALPYLADHEASAGRRSGREGVARMERAARLNPYHPEYQHDLAMAALNSGPLDAERYAEAADRLRRARLLKPADYRFPLLLARLEDRFAADLFDEEGASRRASRRYAEAARLAPLDPRPALEQASNLASSGQIEEALAVAVAALRVEPHFRRARLLETRLLLRLGRLDEAAGSWRSLQQTDAALRDYKAENSYAADLIRNAPEERRRILAALASQETARGPSVTD